ncbi:MAG: metallophosphoesterase [Oscillospiraceae bacterium]
MMRTERISDAQPAAASRKRRKHSLRFRLIRLGVIAILLTAFLWWQDNALETTDITFASAKFPAALNGFTVVQISDLHNKEFGADSKRLLAEIRAASPDLIAITGDLIDSRHTDVDAAVTFCKGAAEIAPVYYISGNHELRVQADYDRLLAEMEQAGVRIVNDKTVRIAEGFWLVGLDELTIAGTEKSPLAESLAAQVPAGAFTLALAHMPQQFDVYAQYGFDLVLCGHAHGGQIRIPFTDIGLYAPGQGLFPDYTAGRYDRGATAMIVSRGLGNSAFPFRIFNRPELVKIVLTNE